MDRADFRLLARIAILGLSITIGIVWIAITLGLAFRIMVKVAGG